MPTKVKRILLVGPTPPPNHGAAQAMAIVAASTTLQQHVQVRHVNTRFATELSQLQKLTPGKVLLLLRYALQVFWVGLTWRPHLSIFVTAFYPGPLVKDALLMLAARLMGRRVAMWIHMDFRALQYERRPAWFRAFVRWLLRRGTHHRIMVGERLKEGYPPELQKLPFHVVENGIPDPALADAQPRTDSLLNVLYLSNMHWDKGWDDLRQAAEVLCDQYPHLHVRFHGAAQTSPTQTELEGIFQHTRHADRICWLGPAYGEAKWAAYRQADIFVMPSHHEALPLVILEAMAHGLPIVATDVGAVATTVAGSQGALLVPPGQPQQLASALGQLIESSERRVALGQHNRQRFVHHFSEPAYINRWIALLQQLA